jgi:hypothetical protein
MARKVKDVVVKNGTYMKDGQEKGRYVNIGAMMASDDGGEFLILNRHINLAGFPNPDNRDSVVASLFSSDRDGGGGQQQHAQQQHAQQQPPQQPGADDMDDDIPF